MQANPYDILYVFAEVHVGFLGFSGLAGVMSRSSWQTKEVAIRFWVLLAFGFMGLVQSFTPLLLSGFIESEVYCFFSAAIVGIGCWFFQMFVFSVKVQAAVKAGEWFRIPKSLNLAYQIPAILSLLFYLSCLWMNKYESYLYLAGLLFFTLAATGNFICFLVANQKVEDVRDGKENI